VATSVHSTCRRQLRILRRAEAGSRPPQAPRAAGAERSGAPGRGRARRYPL